MVPGWLVMIELAELATFGVETAVSVVSGWLVAMVAEVLAAEVRLVTGVVIVLDLEVEEVVVIVVLVVVEVGVGGALRPTHCLNRNKQTI